LPYKLWVLTNSELFITPLLMNKMNLPPDDDIQIRCPRLGHQISFSYCRSENQGLPCFKTLDCWHAIFEVEVFLQMELTSEVFDNTFKRTTKPKLLSLVELIEQAKKTKQENK